MCHEEVPELVTTIFFVSIPRVRVARTAAAIGDLQMFPRQTIMTSMESRFFRCDRSGSDISGHDRGG